MDNIIEVVNLTKKFKDFLAVDRVSFEVKRGEIFAFLGPNGAGKSTTIKMLTTLLRPTAGQMKINGYNPIKQANQVRHSFGIVFQDQSLDDELTAYENMYFHAVLYNVLKTDRKKLIEKFLRFVDLWDRKDDLVKKFSGGMKRRLEIARGLLHKPDIIFLDEPTLGLDAQTRNYLWTYLKDLNKKENITIFFTTHYLQEAEDIAQRIAIMDHVQIIESGTAEELISKTNSKNLEGAFLTLVGANIRQEESGAIDKLRMRRRMFHK